MIKDVDRRQVYCAEDLSAESTILVLICPVEELQSVVDLVLQSHWWNANSVVGPAAIDVSINRSELRSYWQPGARRIRLSAYAADLSTLCHELAHAAVTDFPPPGGASQPDHGAHFRRLHVAIRHAVLGRQCGDDLLEVYDQFGLGSHSTITNPSNPAPWANPALEPACYQAVRRTVPGAPVVGQGLRNAAAAIAL